MKLNLKLALLSLSIAFTNLKADYSTAQLAPHRSSSSTPNYLTDAVLKHPYYTGLGIATVGLALTYVTYNKIITKNRHITVSWEDDPNVSYTLFDESLREYPLFGLYDPVCFKQNLLPEGTINYRNSDTNFIDSSHLKNLLEGLIQEIDAGKKEFKNFTILCDSTFNYQLSSGCLVVKGKDFPFVVKVFRENPYSFVHPLKNSFEAFVLSKMSGFVNRYLLGFTRISNAISIKEALERSGVWSQLITTPRKWFWAPEDAPKLSIKGFNIGSVGKQQKIIIPGTYCVIADALEAERVFSIFNKRDRETVFGLFNDLDKKIDPNFNNFMVEKGTGQVVIIDTEHWPTFHGAVEIDTKINNVITYYLFSAFYLLRNTLFGVKTDYCFYLNSFCAKLSKY